MKFNMKKTEKLSCSEYKHIIIKREKGFLWNNSDALETVHLNRRSVLNEMLPDSNIAFI